MNLGQPLYLQPQNSDLISTSLSNYASALPQEIKNIDSIFIATQKCPRPCFHKICS